MSQQEPDEPSRLEKLRERARTLGNGALARLGQFYRERPRATVVLGVLGGLLIGRRLFRRSHR